MGAATWPVDVARIAWKVGAIAQDSVGRIWRPISVTKGATKAALAFA